MPFNFHLFLLENATIYCAPGWNHCTLTGSHFMRFLVFLMRNLHLTCSFRSLNSSKRYNAFKQSYIIFLTRVTALSMCFDFRREVTIIFVRCGHFGTQTIGSHAISEKIINSSSPDFFPFLYFIVHFSILTSRWKCPKMHHTRSGAIYLVYIQIVHIYKTLFFSIRNIALITLSQNKPQKKAMLMLFLCISSLLVYWALCQESNSMTTFFVHFWKETSPMI